MASMESEIHIHVHTPDLTKQLFEKLDFLTFKLLHMSQNLDKLAQEVAENQTVMQSAVTLLQGLKQRLDEAGTDETKLAQLSTDLDTNTNALAAAVQANTPVDNGTNTGTDTGNTGGETGNTGTGTEGSGDQTGA